MNIHIPTETRHPRKRTIYNGDKPRSALWSEEAKANYDAIDWRHNKPNASTRDAGSRTKESYLDDLREP